MDILRSVTQTVLGSQQTGNQPIGAETVEKLLERVQCSSLLEDRRDGCRHLKALSRKYRLLVGAHGMDTLIQVLESDRNDHEIVNYALESLVNVTSNEIFVEEVENEEDHSTDILQNGKIGEQFSEIFTKRMENIALLMNLLDEFDFKVRYSTMKLLNNLLKNRSKELQEAILVVPNGVIKLLELLADSREIIRNDALLLLTQLTKENTNLQKIVAFGDASGYAFDKVFAIIREEGFSDGGVVVEDCLILLLNLLKNNPSNQNLFKEGDFIQRITNFFDLPIDSTEVWWPPQKIANVHFMLKLVRTLVSPQNSTQVVSPCQRKMKHSGLLQRLCTLLMAVGVPADILSDTIVTVSEVIRGNHENQTYFSGVTAPSTPPRPAIVVLLMSMVNDKQPFMLRCAVLYCFQSYLYKNPTSQANIVQTLLPQTADANEITAGQLLCGGLFSQDPTSNWFASISLSHALLDNSLQKEQLLRVQLATGVGSPPVSLLQQCTTLLEGGSKMPTRLGILQLLCTWLANCPIAVSHLLSIDGVVNHIAAYLSPNEHDEMQELCKGLYSFLLGLLVHFNDDSVPSFKKEALAELISNRVGVEIFVDKIENIFKSEWYSKAAKSPHITAKLAADIAFDHEFTKLFKSLEPSVLRSVAPQMNGNGEEDVSPAEVIRYKDIIREQAEQVSKLKEVLTEHQLQLEAKSNKETERIQESDQNIMTDEGAKEKISALEQQLSEMTYARDYYYYQMVEKDNLLQVANTPTAQASESNTTPDMDNLRKQLEDLQLVLYKKDEEIHAIKGTAPLTPDPLMSQRLEEEKSSIECSFNELVREKALVDARLKEAEAKLEEADHEIHCLRSSDAFAKFPRLQEEYMRLQNEQEDLLVLLTDQETKICELKKNLRNYGEIFDQEDSEDEDDDDLDFEDSGDDDLNSLT